MIRFKRDVCDFCGVCVGVCPVDAIYLGKAELCVDHERCTNCNSCVDLCPTGALSQDAPTGRKAHKSA